MGKYLDENIATTEKQFAEIYELENQLDRQNKITENLQRENDNLKQQLAEKEEENLKLREKYIGLINMNVQEFNKLEKEIEKHNQDKISFAIAAASVSLPAFLIFSA